VSSDSPDGLHGKGHEELEMFDDVFHPVMVTAAEARDQLAELESERALVLVTDLGYDAADLLELADELAVWRHHYVTAAVTEIATLRAELSGANSG
jgi:hypothetical protein